MFSNIANFYTGAIANLSKVTQETSENLENCELPFLFFKNPDSWTRTNNPFKKLISNLTESEKMVHQNGGQRIINPSWNFNGSQYCVNRFVHSSKGYTNGLDDCIAVLLHNGNDAFLYHLAPNAHKDTIAIEHMQRGLAKTIEELKNNNKNCFAVLVGGNKSDGSHSLHQNITAILKKNDINTQEILHADGHKSIYYDLDKGIIIDGGIYKNIDDFKTEYEIVNANSSKNID